jgi:hypothetical protein
VTSTQIRGGVAVGESGVKLAEKERSVYSAPIPPPFRGDSAYAVNAPRLVDLVAGTRRLRLRPLHRRCYAASTGVSDLKKLEARVDELCGGR